MNGSKFAILLWMTQTPWTEGGFSAHFIWCDGNRRAGGHDMNTVEGFEQAAWGWRISPILAIVFVHQKFRSGR
jgi:hypothetical protein